MKSKWSIVVIAVVVLPLCSCSDRVIDLTESEDFAPLVGLCLQCREDMGAAPMGRDVFALVPMSAVPEKEKSWIRYRLVPAGSKVVIDQVEYLESFDGHYLFVRGELIAEDGHHARVDVLDLLDTDWQASATRRLSQSLSVQLEPDSLPIKWDHVMRCSESVPG